MPNKITFLLLVLLFTAISVSAQIYPDQYYVLRTEAIFNNIYESENIRISDDGKSIVLEDSALTGYFILKPDTSEYNFNRGLPSWNGHAEGETSGFKVQMKFRYGNGWTSWLTVGYWKEQIWNPFGATSYGGKLIDIDYVKLDSYANEWIFKVLMKRKSLDDESPSIKKLSFFVSDSRTTASMSLTDILNDNPEEILIPTQHFYQYGLDPGIGGNICSPTTVSMILRSYDIEVEPVQFARDTYDPHYGLFGVWPRVVQNAAEFGLDGAVTRYRNWSETRKVLANGGRIGMSIGRPLYAGHLVMLAGFDSNGNPLVHDPAKTDGYAKKYYKSDISRSWFEKGGIAYTFYPEDEVPVTVEDDNLLAEVPDDFHLMQNYPNPFNPTTNIAFSIPEEADVTIKVFNTLGQEIAVLADNYFSPGNHIIQFNAVNLSGGIYIYTLNAIGSSGKRFSASGKALLLK